MESGFSPIEENDIASGWEQVRPGGSERFEFFRVRRFGALHFVKRPSAPFRNDLLTIEALKKEFHIGYSLSHPSIVRYLGMDGDAIFEEYVDGISLRDMIDSHDGRLRSPEFLGRICRQLLDATAYLHSRGVIHNDIKPENVLVSRIDNQIKLVDFGGAYSDMWDSTQGFTPGYQAPEQGKGETNVYTDIYLVGKLIEELAPIAGVAKEWRKFINRATAEDIDDRFATDSEAIAAIPVHRKSGWRAVGVVGVVAALIIAGIIVVVISRKENDDNRPTSSAEVESTVAKEREGAPDVSVGNLTDTINKAEADKVEEKHADKPEEKPLPTARETAGRQLEEYVAEKYKKEVIPECKKYDRITDAVSRFRQNAYIRYKVMPKAISDVQDYAGRLASQYPSEADYIKTYAMTLLEVRQSEAGVMLEQSYRKLPQGGESVDPDTISAIIREYAGVR